MKFAPAYLPVFLVVYMLYIQQFTDCRRYVILSEPAFPLAVALRHPDWGQSRAYFAKIYQFAIYNPESNYWNQRTAVVKGLRSSNSLKSVTKSRSTQVTR
jgi:hypothetical protein